MATSLLELMEGRERLLVKEVAAIPDRTARQVSAIRHSIQGSALAGSISGACDVRQSLDLERTVATADGQPNHSAHFREGKGVGCTFAEAPGGIT
jgi:hypothetical protein